MKLNSQALLCYGNPEQVAACVQNEFGLCLPAEFADAFCVRPGAVLLFQCSDGRVRKVLRTTGSAIVAADNIAGNISAMLFWQDDGVLRVHVADAADTLLVGSSLNPALPDPQQQSRNN